MKWRKGVTVLINHARSNHLVGGVDRTWIVKLVIGGLLGLVIYKFLGVLFFVLFTVGFVLGILARMESEGEGSDHAN